MSTAVDAAATPVEAEEKRNTRLKSLRMIFAITGLASISYLLVTFGPGRMEDSPAIPIDANETRTLLSGDQHHRALFGDAIHLARTAYKIPHVLDQNLADLWRSDGGGGPLDLGNDLPVFWHVLKSGGTTIKAMYSQCFRLVEACETGISVGGAQGTTVVHKRAETAVGQPQQAAAGPSPWEWMQQQQVQQVGNNYGTGPHQRRRLQQPTTLQVVTSVDGRKYVNVDITTPQGILLAAQLGFATSNLADVIFTPLLHESAQHLLSSDSKRGRMFAVFRHPVERVTSLFYYLQKATWEPTYNPIYASWTIEDYARSEFCESNWMVRSLTGKMTGPLSPDDFGMAQEIVRKKCLVGLMSKMGESMAHFQAYFRFKNTNTYYGNAIKCALDKFAEKTSSRAQNVHDHPLPERGSKTWEILDQKNWLDVRLFEVAEKLFEEQGEQLAGEIDRVMKDATKKNVII